MITETQRDTIYNRLQRGVANAEKVKILTNSLNVCDSIKTIKTEIIGTQSLEIGKLNSTILNLKEIATLEKKKARRKSFWSFIKGSGVGAFLILIGLVL